MQEEDETDLRAQDLSSQSILRNEGSPTDLEYHHVDGDEKVCKLVSYALL